MPKKYTIPALAQALRERGNRPRPGETDDEFVQSFLADNPEYRDSVEAPPSLPERLWERGWQEFPFIERGRQKIREEHEAVSKLLPPRLAALANLAVGAQRIPLEAGAAFAGSPIALGLLAPGVGFSGAAGKAAQLAGKLASYAMLTRGGIEAAKGVEARSPLQVGMGGLMMGGGLLGIRGRAPQAAAAAPAQAVAATEAAAVPAMTDQAAAQALEEARAAFRAGAPKPYPAGLEPIYTRGFAEPPPTTRRPLTPPLRQAPPRPPAPPPPLEPTYAPITPEIWERDRLRPPPTPERQPALFPPTLPAPTAPTAVPATPPTAVPEAVIAPRTVAEAAKRAAASQAAQAGLSSDPAVRLGSVLDRVAESPSAVKVLSPREQQLLHVAAEQITDPALRTDPAVMGQTLNDLQALAQEVAGRKGGSWLSRLLTQLTAKAGDFLPGEEAGKATTRLALHLGTGAMGAVAGAASADTPEERINRAILFGTVGLGLPLLAGYRRPTQRPTPAIPELEKLAQSRTLLEQPPSRLSRLGERGQSALTTRFAPVWHYANPRFERAAQAGRPISGELHPARQAEVLMGGRIGGNVEADWRTQWLPLMEEINSKGLRNVVTARLDIMGGQRGAEKLFEASYLATQRGDTQEAARILNRLQSGQALTQNWTPEVVDRMWNELPKLLDPDTAQETERLAQAVVKFANQNLDLLYTGGLISKGQYGELSAKRAGYVPLQRFLEDVVNKTRTLRGERATTALTAEEVAEGAFEQAGAGRRGGAGLGVKTEQVIKPFKGSPRTTKHPLDLIWDQRRTVVEEVERNRYMQETGHLFAQQPEFSEDWALLPPKGRQSVAGFPTLGWFERGKARRLVPTTNEAALVADTINRASPTDLGFLLGTLRWPSQVMSRFATTLNLGFIPVNPPRDIVESLFYLPNQLSDISTFLKLWVKRLGDAYHYHWPEHAGPLAETVGRVPQPVEEALRAGVLAGSPSRLYNPEAFTEAGKGGLSGVFSAASRLMATVEDTSKMAGFELKKLQGMAKQQAAWEARIFAGTPDIARAGTRTKPANILVPFFGVNVQGLARMHRLLEQPTRFFYVLAAHTLFAIAKDRYNAQFVDPDGTPSEDRMSRGDQENYISIFTPGTYPQTTEGIVRRNIYKFPKSPLQKIMMTPIEHVLKAARTGRTAEGAEDAINALISNALPGNISLRRGQKGLSLLGGAIGSLSPPLATLGQAARNMTEQGYPIVPSRLKMNRALMPWEMTRPLTSPTMVGVSRGVGSALGAGLQALGQTPEAATANVRAYTPSPLMLEQVYKKFLPGLGESSLSLLDYLQRGGPARQALQGQERIANLPVVNVITRRFVGSPVDQIKRDQEDLLYQALAEFPGLDPLTNVERQLGELRRFADQLPLSETDKIRRINEAERRILAAVPPLVARIRKMAASGQLRWPPPTTPQP